MRTSKFSANLLFYLIAYFDILKRTIVFRNRLWIDSMCKRFDVVRGRCMYPPFFTLYPSIPSFNTLFFRIFSQASLTQNVATSSQTSIVKSKLSSDPVLLVMSSLLYTQVALDSSRGWQRSRDMQNWSMRRVCLKKPCWVSSTRETG